MNLRKISFQSGRDLIFEDGKIHFKEIPQSEEKVKDTYALTTNFFQTVRQEFNCGWMGDYAGDQPESAEFAEFADARNWHYRSELLGKNILNDPETRLKLNPKNSTMEVEGTPAEQGAIRQLLRIVDEMRPIQMRVTSRVVSTPKEEELPTRNLTSLEVQDWMRSASQLEGFEFQVHPAIVMLPGRSAEIEVGCPTVNFSDEGFVGVRFECRIEAYGKGMTVAFDYEERFILDGDREIGFYSWDGKPESPELAEILESARENQSILKSGKRELSGAGILADGESLVRKTKGDGKRSEYFFLTVERIDATGRRLSPPQQ